MDFVGFIYSNLSYIFFPISIYFLYILYKRTYEEKENNLFLILVIYSILYIEYKYGMSLSLEIPLVLVNIPLIIAMMKRKNIHVIVISLILVSYFFDFYENLFMVIFLEYILCVIFYFKIKNIYHILIFMTFTQILMQSIYVYIDENELFYYMQLILSSVVFYILSVFIIFIFQKYEELLKIFLSVKEIKQNNQIQNSLFKISHEIKNPIAVCKGYLDMFDIKNEKHVKKYIPILKEEINRSLLILEDFLSMNKLKLNKDILDINMLLEEASDSYRHLFRKNNIDLIVDLIDDEIYIYGDYNRLMQVIINIFKNSFEATDKNKKMQFKITEELLDDYIFIKFFDNGIGISEENLKKIKEPFFTTKIGGTGLGTSLSTEIVEAHRGEINYESKEGDYTIVTIKLPIYEY